MQCEVEEQATRMPMSPSCLSNKGPLICYRAYNQSKRSQRAARQARDAARRAQVNHIIVHWYDFLSNFVLLIILIIFFQICMLFRDKLVELDWLTAINQLATTIRIINY